MPDAPAAAPESADLLIRDTTLVAHDGAPRVLKNAALAVRGDRIVAVGASDALCARFAAREVIDGERFVVTPGLVNAHVHVNGEPLTKGFVPEGTGHADGIRDYLIPFYGAHDGREERLSAQLAALEMLRTGTTSFIEAGSLRHLDEAVDGLSEIGIRARVGPWTWDRSNAPNRPAVASDAAAARLEDAMVRHPADGRRVAAWPSLVGHASCTDALWQDALRLARQRGTGLTFHMSPVAADPAWFLAQFGRRPIEHLADIGLLGPEVVITHAIHLDDAEVALLAETGTHVAHCPMTALKLGYGLARHGLMPEMAAAGVNLCLGTDGANNGNSGDLMRAGWLAAGLFKDARERTDVFPAAAVFDMMTVNGARAMQLGQEIGAIAPGRKADFVLHDSWRPEWRPLHDVLTQLVWSADGRSVHSVWVDGVRVVDNHRATRVDEDRLFALAQAAGEKLVRRVSTPRLG